MDKKIGRAGSGTKVHVVSVFIRPDDGLVINSILCGAQQFNGSGNGQMNGLREFDSSKVTCKRCLKHEAEMAQHEAEKLAKATVAS